MVDQSIERKKLFHDIIQDFRKPTGGEITQVII